MIISFNISLKSGIFNTKLKGMYYEEKLEEAIDDIIGGLVDSEFLTENNITNMKIVREVIQEGIISKVIQNPNEEVVLEDDEFESILRKIMVLNLIDQIKNKGVVNTYNDNDNPIYYLKENMLVRTC